MAVLEKDPSLLSIVNSYKETPLIVAVKTLKSGDVSMADTLLQEYTKPGLRDVILNSDVNGDTALHHAIRHGHENLALKLIRARHELSQKVNKYDESPMYIAVMRGFDEVFQQLWTISHSSHKGAFGDNALHAAVRNANTGIITTIMESRPELARERNKSGHTPIQYAVNRNQSAVISVILERDQSLGYLVNSNQEDNPLLFSAASRGNVDVAREILMHCPDAPCCNKAGSTILHQAVMEGHVKFVEFILANHQLAKLINIRDSEHYTALHHAVKNCNPAIVRALLAHKEIDVRVYDRQGRPAFWQLTEAMDSAKSLNWNEVFMLMSKADPQATAFYLRQVARKKITVKSMQEIKSLTATYTNNTSLVAILIATITFAAAFTLPGGYSNDKGTEGLPIMRKKPAFKAFLISDTLAMCSSLAVAFLCILARWEDLKFLLYYRSLTKNLMWFALMTTTVAFATGLYTVVAPRFQWLAILICTLSVCLPFLTYLLGEWPMLKLLYRLGSAFKSNLLNMI
ncbi:ankyrin repeat family protein [Rhynchospora pubera]|uniref:Ankyrin repeat family protein n=1 Tax=Rhynchospora pubera TaxID=906938 RepID=A0AAV8HPS0_9POAL|nr:ankyrin repeat family protein [Rhynchospora pubera]